MAFSGRHSRQDPALAGYFHPKHSSAGPTTGGPDIRGCADTVVVGGTAADAGGAEPHASAPNRCLGSPAPSLVSARWSIQGSGLFGPVEHKGYRGNGITRHRAIRISCTRGRMFECLRRQRVTRCLTTLPKPSTLRGGEINVDYETNLYIARRADRDT